MTPDGNRGELNHIYGSLSELSKKLDDVYEAVAAVDRRIEAIDRLCSVCRPVVFGNGRQPISERVSLLEAQANEARTRLSFWLSVGAILVSLLHAIAGLLPLLKF